MTDQTPVMLITRPEADAARLAEQLRRLFPDGYDIVLSPLIKIEAVPATQSLADFDAVVFTSVNGVTHAPGPPAVAGQRAFCVGDRTAEAARQAGFDAISASGSAKDLIRLILSQPDNGPLLHLRGADTRGEIAENLGKAGRQATSAIVYRQTPQVLTSAAQDALQGTAPVILPLYSPNTAKALLNQAPYDAPLHVVAISPAVAEVAQRLRPINLITAAQPDGDAMIAAIRATLGGNPGRSGP